MWYCYTSKARYFVVESFECCACLSERSGRAELFIEVKVYPVNFIILQCGLSPPVCWTSHTSCFNNLEFTIFQQQQGALVFGCQLINLSKIVITVTVLFLIHSDGVILITQWRCYSDHSDGVIHRLTVGYHRRTSKGFCAYSRLVSLSRCLPFNSTDSIQFNSTD